MDKQGIEPWTLRTHENGNRRYMQSVHATTALHAHNILLHMRVFECIGSYQDAYTRNGHEYKITKH
jgi:hypothetical protein